MQLRLNKKGASVGVVLPNQGSMAAWGSRAHASPTVPGVGTSCLGMPLLAQLTCDFGHVSQSDRGNW